MLAGRKKKKEAAKAAAAVQDEEKEEEVVKVDYFKAMKENIALLEKAVELKDDKNLIRRLWRKNTALRKNLSVIELQAIINAFIPVTNEAYKLMIVGLDAAEKRSMNDGDTSNIDVNEEKREEVSLEVECYLHIFLVSILLEKNCPKEAKDSSRFLVERVNAKNRRTMDTFFSKAYHYYVQCHENELKTIRPQLIAAHRTACLHLNEHGQAALINLILRSYTEANLVTQAIKFDSTTDFPESASNNQQIRHLYYMGRVRAIQTDYSAANESLIRAMRKAPTNTGLGFRIAVYKLAICVQLLMGETPDRSWFSDVQLKNALEPYFHVVKAVRNGNLGEYDAALQKYAEGFKVDRVYSFMQRIHSSVIKTALRKINLAYSKISFKDVATRLNLGTTDAELVCAKAIRDHIIEARIESDTGILVSTDSVDIYSTIEPKHQFNRRIEFCLEIHNSAVKAHRYPPNSHRPKQEAKKEEEEKADSREPGETLEG